MKKDDVDVENLSMSKHLDGDKNPPKGKDLLKIKNPFRMLNIEPQYPLSLEDLNDAYYKIQREHHPNQHHHKNHQAYSLSSAEVNEAYTTLRDPLNQALWLIQSQGYVDSSQSTPTDPTFLEQAMDLGELLENPQIQKEAMELYERVLSQMTSDMELYLKNAEYECALQKISQMKYWQQVRHRSMENHPL
jgi:Fe-S protein assembly co-chaperone HscB